MTFYKALEAMRQGKKAKIIGDEYPYFIKDDVLYHYDGKGGFEKQALGFDTFMLFNHVDWEIYEPKTFYNSGEPVYNCRCEIKPEEIERLKKTLSENMHICFEPQKEKPTMYTDIEITFKSGETITYSKGEWDDYSYDGKAVSVKKDGAWVGLYNFDNIFCVELKSRED